MMPKWALQRARTGIHAPKNRFRPGFRRWLSSFHRARRFAVGPASA